MRITHVVYSSFGGSGSIVLSLIKQNKIEKKFEDSVIFTGPSLCEDYKKNIEKKKIFFIKTIKFLSFLSWVKIIKKLFNYKPEIIILHNYQIIPCFFYNFFIKSKIIVIDHAAINYKAFRDHVVVFFSKLLKCHIVVLNKANLDYYKKKKINLNRIHLIKNGIDTNFFNQKKTKKKSNNSYFKIGMASRIDYFKRHDLIISSINSEMLRNIKIKVFFAGDGVYSSYLKEKSKKLKVQDKVIFNGKLNTTELKNWFKNLDLYVHATTGEAMSTAILEAFSMKVPVIASKVPGVIEFFHSIDKIDNTFYNNEKILSKKIYYSWKNLKKIKSDGNKLRTYINKNHSNLVMFQNYQNLILKVKEE